MPVNSKEMKVLEQKQLKVGDHAKDHQHHQGVIKEILMSEDETPHPPKLRFEYESKEGEMHEALHFPSALHKMPHPK